MNIEIENQFGRVQLSFLFLALVVVGCTMILMGFIGSRETKQPQCHVEKAAA
jgi:hypothetical protein